MARIPIGNFGYRIAKPAPDVRITPGAFASGDGGAAAGDALFRAGVVGMREEQQEQSALARARAGNAVLDREMQADGIIKEIEQQVSSGALAYKDAKSAYETRIQDLGIPTIDGLDPAGNETFSKGIKRIDFKGAGAIDTLMSRAQTADMRAQTDGLLDKLGKKAGLPGADMASIRAQLDAADEVGLRAYGADWGKRKQNAIDSAWDAQLNQQAMAVRNDLGGINALQERITRGDLAESLDSNRRNTLVARLDGYKTSLIQRQEAAAARAERQQERRMKAAEAEFNTFQAMVDKGTILSPEYIDRATTMTAGTPYQAGIKQLATQAQETGGIAAQPVKYQQAALDAIDREIAQKGRTPALDKRREQVAKVLSASQADLDENGLRAGLERGVITDLSPVDTTTPEAFAASVAKRMEQADTVSMWAGRQVSPLGADEAAQLRSMLDALPDKPKSQAMATIAAAVGPRAAAAMATQLDKQDKALGLAFATAGSKTTAGRYTSELILKGASAIKDGTAMKDDKKVTGWKATIATAVEGAYPDQRMADAVKDAAYFVAAGIAAENGGSVSTSDLERAVRLAVGGDVIERGGKRLPIPAGLSADDFEKRLRNVSADDIKRQSPDGKVRVGGIEMDAGDFAAQVGGQELMYAGPGRYAVIVKGRPVVNSAGAPVIIGVR